MPEPANYVNAIEDANGQDGFTVATGGEESVNYAFEETSESDLLTGETIGISVALIVLLIVFGTLVSAYSARSGGELDRGRDRPDDGSRACSRLSFFVTNMIVMIGLAVGIDYALFIVGRHREELRSLGISQAPVIRSGDTASKAVLFSGMTVVVGLLGMLLVPSSIFNSLGAGAIIVVVVAVMATLTLLRPSCTCSATTSIAAPTESAGRRRLPADLRCPLRFALDVNPVFP